MAGGVLGSAAPGVVSGVCVGGGLMVRVDDGHPGRHHREGDERKRR